MHELVDLVAEILQAALNDAALILIPAGHVDLVELEVRRSSEGDIFWRVVQVELAAGQSLPEGLPTFGVVAGVIERYDP